jgi:hypothetical protein
LFLSEFLLGAAARSTSNKASFSPAAAQAAGIVPFEIVQVRSDDIDISALFDTKESSFFVVIDK